MPAITEADKMAWASFRKDFSGKAKARTRPGKLLRIYAIYEEAGSVSRARIVARCDMMIVRRAIQYVQRKQEIELEAMRNFNTLVSLGVSV